MLLLKNKYKKIKTFIITSTLIFSTSVFSEDLNLMLSENKELLNDNLKEICGSENSHYTKGILYNNDNENIIGRKYSLDKDFKLLKSDKCQNKLDKLITLFDKIEYQVYDENINLNNENKKELHNALKLIIKGSELKRKYIEIKNYIPNS